MFLLALLIPVLLGIYFFVNRGNQDYTTETINSYLELGADVFDFSREQHKQTLLTITSTLTRDWGFRNAFGTGDPATIFDAAQNLLGRAMEADPNPQSAEHDEPWPGGRVKLTGTVDSASDRDAIVSKVRQVNGVSSVDASGLTVK